MFNSLLLFMSMGLSAGLSVGLSSSKSYGADDLSAARSKLQEAPLEAIELLEQAKNSDEKFALLYKADLEVAKRADYSTFAKRPGDRKPGDKYTEYDNYAVTHPQRFHKGGETLMKVLVTDYWIKKIANPRHPVIAEADFEVVNNAFLASPESGACKKNRAEIREKLLRFQKKWPGKHLADIKNIQISIECQ